MNRYNASMWIYTLKVLLILSAGMLPVIACGGGTQPSSDKEADVQAGFATGSSIEARVKDELTKTMSTAPVTSVIKMTASTPKQHQHQHPTI